MNSFKRKVDVAKDYIDAVYRIETMRADGITGLYGLEHQRLKKHEELCDLLHIDREESKSICDYMDKAIGFEIGLLDKDFDFWLEKYAKRLVAQLALQCKGK